MFDYALPTQSIVGATLNRRTKPDAIAVAPPKRLDDNKIDEQPGMFNDEDVDDTNGHTPSAGNIVNNHHHPSKMASTTNQGAFAMICIDLRAFIDIG